MLFGGAPPVLLIPTQWRQVLVNPILTFYTYMTGKPDFQ